MIKPSKDCELNCPASSIFRERKQEGLQRQRETRMALFRQKNGWFLPHDARRLSVPRLNSPPPLTLPLCRLLLQDAADFEWAMWFSTFRNHILFALAGHVIFAKIFTILAPKVRARVRKSHVTWLHADIWHVFIFVDFSAVCNCVCVFSCTWVWSFFIFAKLPNWSCAINHSYCRLNWMSHKHVTLYAPAGSDTVLTRCMATICIVLLVLAVASCEYVDIFETFQCVLNMLSVLFHACKRRWV